VASISRDDFLFSLVQLLECLSASAQMSLFSYHWHAKAKQNKGHFQFTPCVRGSLMSKLYRVFSSSLTPKLYRVFALGFFSGQRQLTNWLVQVSPSWSIYFFPSKIFRQVDYDKKSLSVIFGEKIRGQSLRYSLFEGRALSAAFTKIWPLFKLFYLFLDTITQVHNTHY
jgi:hypothetical protein